MIYHFFIGIWFPFVEFGELHRGMIILGSTRLTMCAQLEHYSKPISKNNNGIVFIQLSFCHHAAQIWT